MSKKIILFLSGIKPNTTLKSHGYTCPDGTTVTGSQTNEAPVEYLLKSYSDVSELLCIVTPQAEETAWERFQATVAKTSSTAKCVKIRFAEDAEIEDILPEVLAHTDAGDEILLETTGGFRNAVMYLLLISRALSYAQIKTICAVYSNLDKKKIEDVSHMLQAFDLIGGMQDMTSFGSVRSLRSYYSNRPHDTKIDNLLDAVYRLWECITLCRPAQVSDCMKEFNTAMKEAADCGDPLLEALLPAFSNKYGNKLNTPALIRWCVDSDMLQQALTIYKERIPIYILCDRNDLLIVKPTAQPVYDTGRYNKSMYDEENKAEFRFHEQFLKIGRNMRKSSSKYGVEDEPTDYTVATLMYMETLLPFSYFDAKCSVQQLRTITMDYLYIRILRNMTNHASDQSLDGQQEIVNYLISQGYPPIENITAEEIRSVILKALNNLKSRRKKPTNGKGKNKPKKEK